MAHNVIPFPTPEQPLDTPASAQECLSLAKVIDEQVDRWGAYARRASLRMGHRGSVSLQVYEDSRPLGREPINYLEQATFGGTLTLEEAKLRTAYEHRRQTLSQWALLDTLDTLRAQNEGLVELMEMVGNSMRRTGVRDEYHLAVQALRRIYIVRERLAAKIGRVSTLDILPYAQITVAMGDDAARAEK